MSPLIREPADLDLAQFIRSGDGIVVGQGTAEPLSLTEQLVAQRNAFDGAGVFLATTFSQTFKPEHADHLRFAGIGGIGTMRKLCSAGVLDPIPCHFSEIEPLLRRGLIRSDVVMLQVSTPNEHGEHSFGLANDYLRTAIASARVVIAEVSDKVPWTPCVQPLRSEEITVAVHTGRAPIELPRGRIGDVERRIAAALADVIPERATLQVGIGAIPDAIVAMLADRRDLGIHSGMIGDSAVDLMESGAVSNAWKGIDPGVTVAGVLFGSKRLYEFAHRNPQLRLCHSSHTHAMTSLARVQRLVSINSALEVDLTGQVNAEAIGHDYIGAVGGHSDFVRGAIQSPGGVSVIALPATGKDGCSRIVHRLSGPVTTSRSDVDVVATEYGIARLRGLSLEQRRRELIRIAAPEHQDSLLREAQSPRT